jgi:hypothetical protein
LTSLASREIPIGAEVGIRFIGTEMLAHALERLHEEFAADYNDMIYAATPEDIALRREASSATCGRSIALPPAATACSSLRASPRANGAA